MPDLARKFSLPRHVPKYLFTERLRDAREKLKMTRKQLAAKAKIPVDTLTKWELGKTDAPLRRVVAVAKALGVSLDWLVGLDEPPENTP